MSLEYVGAAQSADADLVDLSYVNSLQAENMAGSAVTAQITAAYASAMISLTGSPSGGTFTLTYGGHTTTGIAWNATAATVQGALAALSSIGTGNVSVPALDGGPWKVTFQGSLIAADPTTITASGAGLTGGTTPSVTVGPQYVTSSYVAAQNALLATPLYVQTQDATLTAITRVGANNGVAGLTAGGRIDFSRVNVASTQRWPKPFVSPSAYNTTTVTASTAEVQVYTCAVADPGFTYKLFVTGTVSAYPAVDGEFAVIHVRVGTSSGQIIAAGAGLGESYPGGTMTMFSVAGAYSYTPPMWADYLDVVLLGGGGGGGGGGLIINGGAGLPGSWTTSTISSPTGTYVGSVGGGGTGGYGNVLFGTGGGAGTATTLTSPSLSGAGGTGSGGGDGSVGNEVFNGQTYVGGAAAPGPHGNPSPNGNSPGGGGLGGGFNSTGGVGAPGAAWFFAYPSDHTPSGPVTLVPTSFSSQTAITGATTLYVMLINGTPGGGTGTVSASALRPALSVIPFPA